jgi:hypothetical protein
MPALRLPGTTREIGSIQWHLLDATIGLAFDLSGAWFTIGRGIGLYSYAHLAHPSSQELDN